MKKLLISLLFAFFMLPSFAQGLIGTWEGTHFLSGQIPGMHITIVFELNKDSTYKIHTHTRYKRMSEPDLVYDCSVGYDLTGDNSIRLREEALLSSNETGRLCFKQMDLKFKKKKNILQLDGYWQSSGTYCVSHGTLVLTKKR